VMLMYMFQRKIGVSWIIKLKSVSLLVIKMVSKQEFPPMQDEPEKIELELDDAKSESSKEEEAEEAEEEEEEEEPHTPVLRRSVRDRRKPERYSPPDFHSNFALSITDDDPRIVSEAVNSEDSKLWKKAMVEQMDALDKNEAWNIVELPAGRNRLVENGCSRRSLMHKVKWRNKKLS
jgi:hypothetical protein